MRPTAPPLLFSLLLLTPACAAPAGVDPDLSLTLALDADHHGTVLASAPEQAEDCAIVWSADGTPMPSVAIAPGATAWLVGGAAGSEVVANLSCATGDGPPVSIATGDLPSGLPALEIETPLAEPLDDRWILTSGLGAEGTGSITLSNLSGEPVWWESLDAGLMTAAHYDAENGVIFGVMTPDHATEDESAELLITRLAGPTQHFPVKDAHHDTLALGSGRYLVTQSRTQQTTDGLVLGDDLVIVDTTTGALETVWDAFDQLEVIENDGWALQSGSGAADWTHVNSLSQDPDTGIIYASLYYDRSILAIDPETWQTLWELGGPRSDFEVDVPFGPQHSPVRRGDSLWMFDNGANTAAGSALARYEITEPTTSEPGRATRAWSWAPDPAPFCAVLGSIAPGDVTLASWGDTGDVRIISPGDEEIALYKSSVDRQGGFASFVMREP